MQPALNDFFRQIEELSNKVFFLYKVDTREFELLSQGVEVIWEQSRETLRQEPARLLQAIEPEDLPKLKELFSGLRQGSKVQLVLTLKFSAELIKKVKVEAYPLHGAGKEVTAIAGIAEEVTGMLQYEDYLEKYAHRKNTALELIVHDLRVPLAHMKGAAQLIERELTDETMAELQTYTAIIHKAYDQCINLITDVLSDEHLKSPTIFVRKKSVEVVDMVRQLVNDYSSHEGVEVRFEVLANERVVASLDDSKFMQILNNLCSNSLKFTPPDGKVTIKVKRDGRQLLITHSDTGIGIPEELQPHVFTRYSRAGRPGLNGEPTKGIGLAIVRDLVELQGGKIWFESREGQGTTFFLSFPLSDHNEESVSNTQS